MQLIKLTLLTLAISLSSCKTAKYNNLEDGIYADIETSKMKTCYREERVPFEQPQSKKKRNNKRGRR